MRKIASLLFAFLLVSSLGYAQSSRNPLNNDEGKSVFGNVATTGLDVTGNVGYLELGGTDLDGNHVAWYLWVDTTGDLLIASRVTMETMASFPTGDFRPPSGNGGWVVGTVVGGQS